MQGCNVVAAVDEQVDDHTDVVDIHIELAAVVDDLVEGCNIVADVGNYIDLVLDDNCNDVVDIHFDLLLVDNYADLMDIHMFANVADLVNIHNNYIHIDIAVADNIDFAAATLMNYNSIEYLGLSWVHFSTLFLWR